MSEEGRAKLRNLLQHGGEASLEEVQALVHEEPELLEIGKSEESAILLAMRNVCSDEVVLFLLRSTFPESYSDEQSSHWKVLLLASFDVNRPTSPVVVQELLHRFPRWITQHDFCEPFGHAFYWALHLRPEVARLMIAQHPEIANIESKTFGSPIHAAAKLHDRATLQDLLAAYPQGLLMRDDEGLLPLHHVLTNEPTVNLDLFNDLADRMPSGFFQRRNEEDGHLFLHEVAAGDVKFNVDPRIAQAILDRNPEAIMVQDNNGNLPLHLALDSHDEAYPFIRMLMKASPSSLLVANLRGMLPMHVAVSKFMLSSVHDMIDEVPQAIIARDHRGQTPLHVMLEQDMFDKCTAKRMIELYPDILLTKDSAGKVPLHYAVDECQYFEDIDWLEAVELLTQACPSAASAHDHAGKTPIHYAASLGMPHIVMEALFRICAPAVQVPDVDGNLPLIYAAGGVYNNPNHCSLSTIFMLVRHEPGQLLYYKDCQKMPNWEQETSPPPAKRQRVERS